MTCCVVVMLVLASFCGLTVNVLQDYDMCVLLGVWVHCDISQCLLKLYKEVQSQPASYMPSSSSFVHLWFFSYSMDIRARWWFVLLEVVIGGACCLGNALVIWASWTYGVFREPTFCFITSLAVADFLVGSVGIPLALLLDMNMEVSFHDCLSMCCVLLMLQIASVVLLLTIAVDRCLRVRIPLSWVELFHIWIQNLTSNFLSGNVMFPGVSLKLD